MNNKSLFTPFLKIKNQGFEPLFPAIANKIAQYKLSQKRRKATQSED
jgi:hypothetical protein|tara:strand:+ start:2252 stop:2392 length:141 start_codon:yes stop_codon:yes gene_type:complete